MLFGLTGSGHMMYSLMTNNKASVPCFLRRLAAVLMTCLLSGITFAAAPETDVEGSGFPPGSYYRYYNAEGIQVMDFSIPPEYADKGYEVLSPRGRLLKIVPARTEGSVTAEEIAAREEQKKEDVYILKSYTSLEDVERARKRRLELVEREIGIIKSNIAEYRRREKELKSRAAAYQASGQSAPEAITELLAELEMQRINARKQLAERRKQYDQTGIRFDRHRQRLQELRPELRTESESAETAEIIQETGEKDPSQ